MAEIKRRVKGKLTLVPGRDGVWRLGRRRLVPAASPETAKFEQLISEVCEVYRPTGVLIWLNSPNKHFGGKSPRELIESGTDDNWAQLLNESGRLASW